MTLNVDHARINAAIAKAEETTSGEITCVMRTRPYDYPETPLLWGFAAAILMPLLLALLGFEPAMMLNRLLPPSFSQWDASTALYLQLETLALNGIVQLIIFGAVAGIIHYGKFSAALTPRFIKIKRAHQAALDQFKSRGLHLTTERTGVMIFAALSEHFVEVIADEGIYSKVDKSVWNDTVALLLKHIKSDDLTSGFEAAIAKSSEVLSAHFPPGAINPNELPDVLIEV